VTSHLGTRITQHKIDSIESFTKKYQIHPLSIRVGRTWLKIGDGKCASGDRLSRELPEAAWQGADSRDSSTRRRLRSARSE
jgi:hypothetical protein